MLVMLLDARDTLPLRFRFSGIIASTSGLNAFSTASGDGLGFAPVANVLRVAASIIGCMIFSAGSTFNRSARFFIAPFGGVSPPGKLLMIRSSSSISAAGIGSKSG